MIDREASSDASSARLDATRTPVPVLMYHSIDTEATPAFSPYITSPSVLRAHLDYLADSGYTTLTVEALAHARSSGEILPERPVVLTFDDGFRDFHEQALGELADRGMTATLFVPTGYIGATTKWLKGCGEESRPMLSWNALREVSAAGVEVAAHSHTHPELDRVSYARASEEARDSRKRLEDTLGSAIEGFAYPYGYWNRRVRTAVRSAGYSYACEVGELTSSSWDDRLAIPRHSVNNATDLQAFGRLLRRSPSRQARVLAVAKRVVWRAARSATSAGNADPGAAG